MRAVEHADERRFDDVVEVMPERDFIAAELSCLGVEVPPPHARAEITGRFFHAVGGGENFRREHREGELQRLRVFEDARAVLFVVAGVHRKEDELEVLLAVSFEQFHELGEQHAVLPARDAHGDLIALLDERIAFDRLDEGVEEGFSEFFDDAALDLLAAGERSCHNAKRIAYFVKKVKLFFGGGAPRLLFRK